jgi:hypothetical protein
MIKEMKRFRRIKRKDGRRITDDRIHRLKQAAHCVPTQHIETRFL